MSPTQQPNCALSLYVYYRAAAHHSEAVAEQVAQMQKKLRDQMKVQCGLMRRPTASSGEVTWMEVYQGILSGADKTFEAALDVAFIDTSLAGIILGQRHLEYFTQYLPCE